MNAQKRNKQTFYFAPYIEKRPVTQTDEWGNTLETGEWEVVYGPPTKTRANISAAKGEAATRIFGEEISYDKQIAIEATPIDEFSILWIDTLPVIDEEGKTETPHDYVVKRIARSLNSVTIAVNKVNVSK